MSPAPQAARRELVFLWLWSCLTLLWAAAYVFQALPIQGIRDAVGNTVGLDFPIFYAASSLFHEHGAAALYTPEHYLGAYRSLMQVQDEAWAWPYTPHIMLWVAPLGYLSYQWALLAWNASGVALALTGAQRLAFGTREMIFLCLSPAVAMVLLAGQSALIIIALIVIGLGLREKKPILAGLFFALAAAKPQLGVLVPVLLLAERNYRCFAASSLWLLTLLTAMGGWLGWDAIENWLNLSLPAQRALLEQGAYAAPTIFMTWLRMGGNIAGAYAAQIMASMMIMIAFYKMARQRSADTLLAFGIMMPLAVPYFFAYDMVMLAFGVIYYLLQRHYAVSGRISLWLLTLWLSPFLVLADFNWRTPFTVCLLLGSSFYLYRRAR